MNCRPILVRWSDEDSAFIAEVPELPELPGCMAHGDTQEEALHHAKEAMTAWIEVAQEIGRPIPEPRVCRRTGGKQGKQRGLYGEASGHGLF